MVENKPHGVSSADRFRKQSGIMNDQVAHFSEGAHLGSIGAWNEIRTLDEVNNNLPKFHEKSLTQLVKTLPPHSRIWDLGSGDRAIALSELVSSYPELHLQGVGVTLPLERENIDHPDNVAIVRMDVEEYLRTYDRSERPDIIYMSRLLEWVPHPLSTIKKAYNALANDGILLVDAMLNEMFPLISPEGNVLHPNLLEKELKKDGYDVQIVTDEGEDTKIPETYSFAIRKTENHSRLRLPIRPVPPEEVNIDLMNRSADSPFANVLKNTQYVYMLTPQLTTS